MREAALAGVDAVFEVTEDLGVPMRLSELDPAKRHCSEKVEKDIFEAVADDVMNYRLLADTPVKIGKQQVIEILEAAF